MPPGDPEALRAGLRRLLDADGLRSRARRRRASSGSPEFSLARLAERYVPVYETADRGRAPDRGDEPCIRTSWRSRSRRGSTTPSRRTSARPRRGSRSATRPAVTRRSRSTRSRRRSSRSASRAEGDIALLLGGPRPRAVREPARDPRGRPGRRHPPGGRRARVVLRVHRGRAARRARDARRRVVRRGARAEDRATLPRRARRRRAASSDATARRSPSRSRPTPISTRCSGPPGSAAGRRCRWASCSRSWSTGRGCAAATSTSGRPTFNITRIVTGQLDAYVDVGRRILDEIPETEPAFLAVGDGTVCTNFPYDVAAAALILEEAGGVDHPRRRPAARRPPGGRIGPGRRAGGPGRRRPPSSRRAARGGRPGNDASRVVAGAHGSQG